MLRNESAPGSRTPRREHDGGFRWGPRPGRARPGARSLGGLGLGWPCRRRERSSGSSP